MTSGPLYFKSISGSWLRLSDSSGFGPNNYFSTNGSDFNRLVMNGYANYCMTVYEPRTGFEGKFEMQKDLKFVQGIYGFGKHQPIFRPVDPPEDVVLHDYPIMEQAKWLGEGFGLYFLVSEDVLNKKTFLYLGNHLSRLVKVSAITDLGMNSWDVEINGGLFQMKPLGYYWEGFKLTERGIAAYDFRFEDNVVYISHESDARK